MTLVLVPVPPDHLERTYIYLAPFLSAIAHRSGNDIREMERMLHQSEAQAFLVWDPERQKAQAFLGVKYELRGKARVGTMIWMTGDDRKAWTHLFAELKQYLVEHQKCSIIAAICRPGWEKSLKAFGFRTTHFVMEMKP